MIWETYFSKRFKNGFLKTFFKPFTIIVFRELDYLRSFNDFAKPCSNRIWLGLIQAFQRGLRNVFSKRFEKGFLKTFFKPSRKTVLRELDYLRSFNDFVKPCSNLAWIGFIQTSQKGLRNVFF